MLRTKYVLFHCGNSIGYFCMYSVYSLLQSYNLNTGMKWQRINVNLMQWRAISNTAFNCCTTIQMLYIVYIGGDSTSCSNKVSTGPACHLPIQYTNVCTCVHDCTLVSAAEAQGIRLPSRTPHIWCSHLAEPTEPSLVRYKPLVSLSPRLSLLSSLSLQPQD